MYSSSPLNNAIFTSVHKSFIPSVSWLVQTQKKHVGLSSASSGQSCHTLNNNGQADGNGKRKKSIRLLVSQAIKIPTFDRVLACLACVWARALSPNVFALIPFAPLLCMELKSSGNAIVIWSPSHSTHLSSCWNAWRASRENGREFDFTPEWSDTLFILGRNEKVLERCSEESMWIISIYANDVCARIIWYMQIRKMCKEMNNFQVFIPFCEVIQCWLSVFMLCATINNSTCSRWIDFHSIVAEYSILHPTTHSLSLLRTNKTILVRFSSEKQSHITLLNIENPKFRTN